ncbi:MAG: UvrD-helicase domain-containing protein [Polyangiaceae bacterium]
MSAHSLDVDGDAILYAFRRNLVVAASAGTGKTHRLTALYVMLALGLTSMASRRSRDTHPPIAPGRIVATTFSRAAALEIRLRVERSLRAIADGDPNAPFQREFAARLTALDEPPSTQELRARATRALAGWHEARIETLHGLAGDLLRRYAAGFDLNPRLRVVDEEEGRDLAYGVIDELLAEALEGSETDALGGRTLVTACGGFFRTREVLAPLFDRLDEDGVDLARVATSDHLARALAQRAALSAMVERCAAGGDSARAAIAELARALAPHLRLTEAANDISPALSAEGERALVELFSARKPSKNVTVAEADLFSFRDELPKAPNAERARNLATFFAEAPELEARERAVLALVSRMRERLLAERRATGVIGFGDMLRLARDGLRDRRAVAEAIRDEVDVLLVDEFQDTSLIQRDLVYLLRERADAAEVRPLRASPSAAGILGHGLMLVGDRKQSIYAFRGADVAVFNRVAAELVGPPAAEALGLSVPEGAPARADLVALRKSYRSGPAVTTFTNALFRLDFATSNLSDSSDVHVAFGPAEELESVRAPADDAVYLVEDTLLVRALPSLTPPARAPEDRSPSLASLDPRRLREVNDAAPLDPLLESAPPALREAFIAAAAARALIDGSLDAKHPTPLEARDIAILVRRRATIPLVELALSRLGLPYVVAGRALFDTREVRDLAGLLHLLIDPRDRFALAQTLRGPLVGLSDSALVALTGDDGLDRNLLSSTSPGLDKPLFPGDAARLELFRARFAEVRFAILRLSAGEAVSAAVRAFDLDRLLAAMPRASARIANVDRIVRLARERQTSLVSFSRWLARQMADGADEAEAVVFSAEDDAIRLSTVHASKGLDFPATIVLDLNGTERAASPPLSVAELPGDPEPRLALRQRGALGARIPNPITTFAGKLAQTRASAERARISYVALTRAERKLVLVGTPAEARRGTVLGSISALVSEPSTAHLVQRIIAEELLTAAFDDVKSTSVVGVRDAPSSASSGATTHTPPSAPLPAPTALASEVSIATTPLGVFLGCPRRFRFRYLLGLEEPIDTGQLDLFEVSIERFERRVTPFDSADDEGDPRARGRAVHRLLERADLANFGAPISEDEAARRLAHEGLSDGEARLLAPFAVRFLASACATRIGQSASEVHREEELVVAVPPSAPGEPTLSLHGTVDLWARVGDEIDLLDYKLARPAPSLAGYEFQLRAYALALSRAVPGARVRAGVVFLEGDGEPRWLPGASGGEHLEPADHAAFERVLSSAAADLARARQADTWSPVPVETCRKLHCGFVTACHRGEATKTTRTRSLRKK